jgi:hypothetical protein
MNPSEETAADGGHSTEIGDAPEQAPAERRDAVSVHEVELAASRAAVRLQRALADDDEGRALLLELHQALSALQAQVREWEELLHLLHQVLVAFSPFHAHLRALGSVEAGPPSGRALLQGWRPCQIGVDRLVDFEGRMVHIRSSHPGEGATAQPEWGARIATLRHEMEDRLREEKWSIEGLTDLADEFNHACGCYLNLVDRELRRAIEKAQRLHTQVLGGLR